MSSLAATQADGYYVPPEYYESGQYKRKSRNRFADSKGHNQYLQRGVVRFELPHDGFCVDCGAHVGRGTRFNAAKTRAGNYFSTTIWEFRMKCRICAKCEFVIRTNPRERDFDYVEGIHRQIKELDGTNEAGTAGVVDTHESEQQSSTTTLARLESTAAGLRRAMTEHDELCALMKINSDVFQEDAASNAKLRATFRNDRRHKKRRLQEAASRGWREGMELVEEETVEDVARARSTCFGSRGKEKEQKTFRKLRTSSIFDDNKKVRRQRSRRQKRDATARPDGVVVSSESSVPVPEDPVVPGLCQKELVQKIQVSNRGSCVAISTDSSAGGATKKDAARLSSLAALADYDSDSDTS